MLCKKNNNKKLFLERIKHIYTFIFYVDSIGHFMPHKLQDRHFRICIHSEHLTLQILENENPYRKDVETLSRWPQMVGTGLN